MPASITLGMVTVSWEMSELQLQYRNFSLVAIGAVVDLIFNQSTFLSIERGREFVCIHPSVSRHVGGVSTDMSMAQLGLAKYHNI